ncbi:NUDIX hydrolase [Longimycelium tulufanense]|uniref:NUDIX hydrolase n=1 Tax=Longimycelium tulufanense TaxID=907463 RepID=A0A8J3CB91_9PSEU|nr:NUDIX hydrolase [Longimycelium tulufanense]GGM40733.1 NUDIX hydrolase [Longimycelium tulufanense]
MAVTDRANRTKVRAAGAVLWRDAGGDGTVVPDGVEVAVVHRPRYDDWTLPKGKLDDGETVAAAAVREVAEETGFRAVLGRRLPTLHYDVSTREGGRARKRVDFFAAHTVDGEFVPSEEVDELRWLPPETAAQRLTYGLERDLLAAFTTLPVRTRTVLLVRHAKAGKRESWSGDDDLRPLTAGGRRQAEGLRRLLPLFGADQVYSAPRVRCVQTVQALADDLGVGIRTEPLLSEEGYWPDPEVGLRRLLEIAATPGTPVVSSQGGVIPDMVARLAQADGVDLSEQPDETGTLPSRKGSLWVLSFRAPSEPARNGVPAPQLVAADYVADPLP